MPGTGWEHRVSQEHLDALCHELSTVVADAERSGNRVVETWRGFGNAVALKTARPVLDGVDSATRAKLLYKPVDDPHHWRGEIHCGEHREWFIVLPMDPTETDRLGDLGIALLGP